LGASEANIRITKTVSEALKLMDIELLDHLILTYEEKYSTIETDGLESG
jgi:DNA repair protein RadC